MRLSRFVLTAAILGAFTSGMALSDTPHQMRETLMKGMSGKLAILGAMVQGKAPYDAAAATTAATELAALAAQDVVPLFPEGSAEGDGNRALPAIWNNMDDFLAKHTVLTKAAADLAPVAGNGLDALKAGFGPVGGACAACHKEYRAPE